jgi:hypothetical protein
LDLAVLVIPFGQELRVHPGGDGMAKRDPEKTARNKRAETLRLEMDELLEQVLEDTGCGGLQSLNAKIGSKHEQLVNIKSRTIPSHDEFISLYLDGRDHRLWPHAAAR